MAIKYLAGDRLIGTAAERAALITEANPTYTPVLTSSSGWSEEGGSTYHSIDTSNNELDFRNKRNPAGDRSISYDLGATVSDTAWVMRFKLDIDVMNIPAGGAQMENISLTDSDSSVLFQTTSQDSLGFSIGWYSSASSERDFMALHGNNTNLQSNYTYIGTDIIVVGTWYVEIKRLTATSMSVRVTTSSDYTGGTLVTKTDVSASTDGLRYFKMAINNGADQANYMDGSISAIKIWDGVTSASADKSTITDVPAGTRYNETDTRKIFSYGTDLVDGAGLKAYYRFTEASGNIDNVADEVTDNDTVGGVLTVNNGGDADHIDYQESTATDNIPSVARWARTSAQDGAYADASGASSLWNFLHYNSSNTSNQPNCTVCWWYNTGTIENNTEFFTTTRGENGVGNRGLRIYQSNWSGSGVSWRIWVSRSGGNLYLLEASVGDIASDDEWHFYSITYDGSTMTLKKDLANTRTTSVSGSPASGDAYAPLSFQHVNAGQESYIPPPNNTAELSIWDRVLTSAELIKIYNSGAGMNLITGVDVWKEKGV